MEFSRIWRVLVSNKWVLIWLPLVATSVSLGVTYILPEQYESTALVLVHQFKNVKFNTNRGERSEYQDFPVNLSAPIDAPSKTYIEVIKSTAVAEQIVNALHLDRKAPKQYDSLLAELKTWFSDSSRTILNYLKYGRDIPASPFELAVEDIQKKLAVSPRKDTYAFDIAYRASDPKEAAAVANMAAEIFLEQRAETYRSESAQSRQFIETQLDQSRKELEQARTAVLAYKNSGETFDPAAEYKEKLRSLTDLENTLAKAEGGLAGLKSILANPNNVSVIEKQASINDLKRQIAALRAELGEYADKEMRLNALTLTQRLAEENYDFFRKQYEEARANEAARIAEIRIASRAVPSLYPAKPLKYVYAGLSFVTALVAAIGWAFLWEAIGPRMHTPRDIRDEKLGTPVLAGMPNLHFSGDAPDRGS